MSIATEITRINNNIAAAYAKLLEMGATIPQAQNSANLASTIQTIPQGVISQPIYGVSGLADDSSVTLTRTDDAENMSYVIDSSTGAITSDFNNAFPWNEAQIVNDAAGKFLLMPDMYFRIGKNANGELTDIAVSKTAGSTGTWIKVDSFLYGCYGSSTSDGKSQSISGATRQVSETRAQFRAKSAQNGNDHFQLDLYHRTVMLFLWLIEWATKKSDSVMTGRIAGSGTRGGNSVRPTGGTDNVTTPSGYEIEYGQMRYHYIEDFVGNLWEFVDGVNCMASGSSHYVTDDPAKFSDSETNYDQLSYTVPSSNNIMALGWDDNNPFMCMPIRTVNNSSYNTGFCDRWNSFGSGYPVLYCGANWGNSYAYCGLTCFYTNNVSVAGSNIGGRLLKKAS